MSCRTSSYFSSIDKRHCSSVTPSSVPAPAPCRPIGHRAKRPNSTMKSHRLFISAWRCCLSRRRASWAAAVSQLLLDLRHARLRGRLLQLPHAVDGIHALARQLLDRHLGHEPPAPLRPGARPGPPRWARLRSRGAPWRRGRPPLPCRAASTSSSSSGQGLHGALGALQQQPEQQALGRQQDRAGRGRAARRPRAAPATAPASCRAASARRTSSRAARSSSRPARRWPAARPPAPPALSMRARRGQERVEVGGLARRRARVVLRRRPADQPLHVRRAPRRAAGGRRRRPPPSGSVSGSWPVGQLDHLHLAAPPRAGRRGSCAPPSGPRRPGRS